MNTRILVATFALVVMSAGLALAVDGDKGQYIGGTILTLKEKAEAKFDTSLEEKLVFDAGKDGRVSIPYAGIQELEYGQKAGRRVKTAIFISPLALFSKSRKHFFTITYTDQDGKDQVGMFELGKNIFRPLMKIVEVRSKRQLILQDNEACKQYKSAKECEGGK